MTLALSKLTCRVRLVEPSLTDAGNGGQIEAPAGRALSPEYAWASVEPVSGRELLTSDAPHAAGTHRLRMRYHPQVTPRTRVEWQGRRFEVLAVLHPGMARRELELLVAERTS